MSASLTIYCPHTSLGQGIKHDTSLLTTWHQWQPMEINSSGTLVHTAGQDSLLSDLETPAASVEVAFSGFQYLGHALR